VNATAPPVAAAVLPAVGHPIELEEEIWINLGSVAMGIHCCDPDALIRKVEGLSLELAQATGAGWPSIRRRDLPALVGEPAARGIAANQGRFGVEFVSGNAAGHQLPIPTESSERMALAERRGVMVDRTGGSGARASRSGLVTLRRILERERAASRPSDRPGRDGRDPEEAGCDDWVPGERALPLMRRAMKVHPVREIAIDVTDRNRPREDPDAELVERCGAVGVRWRKSRTGRYSRGRAEVVGFDLYRLLGITLPGMDLGRYAELMHQAYVDEMGREPPRPAA
jgi:hypothetical protein